jgi:alpha-tubulin suppressor-like RCC1 family protein
VDSTTPVDVIGFSSGAVDVTCGEFHTCAVTASNGMKCWGYNDYGQLGDGTQSNELTPVDVSGLTSGVAAVTAGAYFTCAVTITGGVKCWGENKFGQLGDGIPGNKTAPADVQGISTGSIAIASREDHTCAVTSSGGVKCWGENKYFYCVKNLPCADSVG